MYRTTVIVAIMFCSLCKAEAQTSASQPDDTSRPFELHAQTNFQANPSTGSANTETPLKANASSTLLQGGVNTDQKATPITTIERDATSVSPSDLRGIAPILAPDISRALQSQLNRQRQLPIPDFPRSSDSQLNLQQELPTPDVSAELQGRLNRQQELSTPDLSGELQSQLNRLRQLPELDIPRQLQSRLGRIQPLFTPDLSGVVQRVPRQTPYVPIPPTLSPGITIAPVPQAARLVDPEVERQMQAQLRNRRFKFDVDLDREITGELRRSTPASGWYEPPTNGAGLPVMPHQAPPSVPPNVAREMELQLRRAKSGGHLDSPDIQQQVNAELSAAKRQNSVDSSTDVDAVVRAAKRAQEEANERADTEVKAIMATLRTPPPVERIPTGLGDGSEVTIPWGAWHTKFAQLAAPKLFDAINGGGVMSGRDAVEVTVYRDNRIAVRLVERSNSGFDSEVLDAYRSLNRNPGLAFPPGSRRQSVTFVEDVAHDDAAVSGVSSHSLKNDVEHANER